jgi:hypothetical protein
MDPDACFYQMAEADAHAEWTKAKERATALRRWLESGEFEPKITGHLCSSIGRSQGDMHGDSGTIEPSPCGKR